MRAVPPLLLILGMMGCGSLGVQEKASELRLRENPAAEVGDTLGFLLMSPVTAALLPITVPLVHLVDVGDPYEVLLYPSLRFGELLSVLLGAPVDLIFR